MGKGKGGRVMTRRKFSIEKKTRIKKTGDEKKITKQNPGRINDPNRVRPKGMTHLRDKSTIKRLKMYTDRAIRDRNGNIIQQRYMRRDTDTAMVRIRPDRRWFGNTKVISQKQLQLFRRQMRKNIRDPYTVVLKSKKIPYALLDTSNYSNSTNGASFKHSAKLKLLNIESFDDTFGPNMKRKKPKMASNSMQILAERAEKLSQNYSHSHQHHHRDREAAAAEALDDSFVVGHDIERVFLSGQSTRIKSELYKVIDSSDVILQVIDGRDPMGTRSPHIEKYIKTNCAHKHVVLVLNKVDLIPVWCTRRWMKLLSAEYPTIAFKATKTNNNFGKGALISLLRQFRLLHRTQRRTISVGLIGYPNVGKSSVINALIGKKVCSVAPLPGQTKVWQYVALFDKFYLIDCPGVVYPRPGENIVTSVLRSVVRIESIEHPEQYVAEILQRIRKEYIQKQYEIEAWTSAEDFMNQLAIKRGKLLKKAEPDYNCVAVQILHDWQRGRLPWFISPPFEDDLELENKLRLEKKRFEEERTKLRNHKHMDESEFQPVSMIKDQDIQVAHDFFMDDVLAHEQQRQKLLSNDNNNKQLSFAELDENTQNVVMQIKVSNPLDLDSNDPIIISCKMRQWRRKNKRNK